MRIEGPQITNQRTELAAILLALERNSNNNIRIFSDSTHSLTAVTRHLTKWEDKNWHKIKNEDLLKGILHHIRTHEGNVEFQQRKARSENGEINEANKLADRGRLIGENLDIQGLSPQNS